MHKERFGVIVLAAGASTRMGAPKQLLKLDGEPLLRRAASVAIGANFGPVIIVLGANAEVLRSSLDGMNVDVALNADWQTGMASSIRCGLKRLLASTPDCDGALLMVADQPNITSESLNKILKVSAQQNASVVAAKYNGILGTPVFFAREYFERLLTLEGNGGAKKLLEALGDQVLPFHLPEAAEDLDTPGDLATFIANTNRSPKHPDNSLGVAGRENIATDEAESNRTGQTRRQFMTNVTVAGAGIVALPTLIQRLHAAEPSAVVPLAVGGPSATVPVKLRLNGTEQTLQLDPRVTLLDALRDKLGLTGTKKGCDHGQCGACTVLVNGRRINSCLALAVVHDGDEVTTIEGFAHGDELHPVQKAFLEHDGFQCGYCTPGQICSAVALIKEGHAGTDDEIREWMSGNICRCGAYTNIVAAIRDAKIKEAGAI